MDMESVDLLIIGSGQGGVPLAGDYADAGKRVVLFERGRVGGSCVNFGCTPTKAFLGAAHAAGRARLSGNLGVECEVRVDFPRLMERVRGIRDAGTEGVEGLLKDRGVKIVRAEACFDKLGNVVANGRTWSAPVVVVDTGSRALVPPIDGLDGVPYLTDHNVWELEELPPRLAVIGGGYIGLELGQGFARLGSRVEIFEQGERILATESADVGDVLREALEGDGAVVHANTAVERVEHEDGVFRLHSGGTAYEADALLVAVGRRPNTDALEAEKAGLQRDDQGYIRIDAQLKAGGNIYAIGEAAGQPAFTHVAWEDYRRLKAVLEGGGRRRDDRVLGYAVFTEPQVGRAGLSREQAQAAGYTIRTAQMAVKDMARGRQWGHDLGFYRLIFDGASDRLLGAELVGFEAAEIVHVLLDLMEMGATARQLGSWQHIHPTYGENLPTLARQAD